MIKWVESEGLWLLTREEFGILPLGTIVRDIYIHKFVKKGLGDCFLSGPFTNRDKEIMSPFGLTEKSVSNQNKEIRDLFLLWLLQS